MKNMKRDRNEAGCPGISEAFYGSATLGERGQIVIPAEARAELGLQPGDKMLILRHPGYKGLMLCKFEAMREFLDDFQRTLETIDRTKEDDVL
jgi:AbrB family looped-hinge helix DNA binding protein